MLSLLIGWISLIMSFTWAEPAVPEKTPSPVKALEDLCKDRLQKLPGGQSPEQVDTLCKTVRGSPQCTSHLGEPIFYFEREAQKTTGKRILVMGLIHGDEEPSGSVAKSWAQRLTQIAPRNHWRVIPMLNPDGWIKKTRNNANGVDLNRNFPTQDWNIHALNHWKTQTKSDPRRYPGTHAASEKETQCAVHHIEEFKPDFIVSIHTPYGLLDFDGPKKNLPRNELLPWKFLGHYPGSLGRFMWHDKQIPVLTIELKESGVIEAVQKFDSLQDIAGQMALAPEKK